MPALLAFVLCIAQKVKKIIFNYLANIVAPPTFALPKENWVLHHVSANQNQITVL
jgi:hypothetical protein